MRRLTLSCLSAALLLVATRAASAQTNPFVSAAVAPGVQSIPAPPTPPQAHPSPAAAAPIQRGTPAQAAHLVFGALPEKRAGRDARSLPGFATSRSTGNLEQARPGQTVTAPPLPAMPPLPTLPKEPAVLPSVDGSPDFGGNVRRIDPVALAEQTQPVKALKFVAETGTTYRLVMSSVSPNLIMSPFAHPQLIMTSANAVHFVAHGSSLVVTVAPGQPIGAYITGQDSNDPLVALVFEPRALPPQNYVLQVDGFVVKAKSSQSTSSADGGAQAVEGSSNQHTQRVVRLIEQTLSGSIPDGFGPVSRRHWPLGRNQGGLVVEPVEVLSSGDEVLDVLSVTNTTAAAVALEENDFYRRGVEGVALSDHRPLASGASLRVAILRKASESDASDTLMSVSHP